MTPEEIVKRIETEGVVWLGGEMEFPAGLTCAEAYYLASKIAEDCGYLVGYKYGRSSLEISGGDICGYIVLDWFRVGVPGPLKVEVWTSQSAYNILPMSVEAQKARRT